MFDARNLFSPNSTFLVTLWSYLARCQCAVAYRVGGGCGVYKLPPPPEIPKALQNRAKTQPDFEKC